MNVRTDVRGGGTCGEGQPAPGIPGRRGPPTPLLRCDRGAPREKGSRLRRHRAAAAPRPPFSPQPSLHCCQGGAAPGGIGALDLCVG